MWFTGSEDVVRRVIGSVIPFEIVRFAGGTCDASNATPAWIFPGPDQTKS